MTILYPSDHIVPVEQPNRIQSLDVIRGVAILGILMMNIQIYAQPAMAYTNPHNYGDLTGVNYAIWFVSHLLFDSKFISLFSMLFGAGMVLMTSRIEARGGHPGFIFYRRTFVMGLMGLVHAYLIWEGDVLTRYAMCALYLYWLRNLSPRTLLFLAIVFHLAYIGIVIEHGLEINQLEGVALQTAIEKDWLGTEATTSFFLSSYRGGYIDQMALRWIIAYYVQVTNFFAEGRILQISSMMLLGMALLKWGVLSGSRSNRLYLTFFMMGFLLGIPLTIVDMVASHKTNWDFQTYSLISKPLYLFSAPFISLLWISLIVWLVKSRKIPWLVHGFSVVGQMALTNYLMQSIFSTLFFYGHGFGWYGYLERDQLLIYVFSIWAIQIAYSVLWIKFFRFGPFEWLWRTLTYFHLQPLWRGIAEA